MRAIPPVSVEREPAMCMILLGGDHAKRLGLQPAGNARAQKSIAGALRAPDWMPVTPLQASSAYLGFRAGFRSVSLAKRPCFRYLPEPFRNPSVNRATGWNSEAL